MLCPSCAAVYSARKEAMERELGHLTGIKTMEIEI